MIENLGEYLEQAPLLAILVSFAGGVLTSFTPCLFPVIPITIGVIGARQSTSRFHAFRLSLAYVCGMAIIYAILGMIAAFTGQLFGSVSVHPATNIIIANVCILFGLNMLDVLSRCYLARCETLQGNLGVFPAHSLTIVIDQTLLLTSIGYIYFHPFCMSIQ